MMLSVCQNSDVCLCKSYGNQREKKLIPKTKNHITMIGITDNDETVIAWNSTASDVIYGGQKLQTINSATVAVEADYFIA
ncbi:unnamed protein product [Sphagnum jensenii]|uniref:Uncharacterized protein n=1 Tax=Sphagnum jensenii TaxID=128206 RepID=A0ABP0X3I9_9BRYO